MADESKSQLDILREWLGTQPHIPEIDDLMLKRFLHSCYYNVADTKKCIELFYTLRNTNPKIFDKRDPQSADIQKVLGYTYNVYLTNTKDAVRIWKLNDPGMNNYDHGETTKAFMMMCDVTFMEERHMPERDIFILDCGDITLKFLAKANLSVLKNSVSYLQDALPVRLKQLHCVNAPSYIDKLYAFVKPFVSQNVIKLIHFHKPNSETIFDHVGRDLIPNDYGGTGPSMDKLKEEWVKRVENKRDFFVKDMWRADDNKRSKDSKLEHVNGSFKTLAID